MKLDGNRNGEIIVNVWAYLRENRRKEMKNKRLVILIILIIVVVLLLAYFSTANAQNLLQNSGCEDELVGGEIPDWNEIIGTNWTHRSTNPMPYEGNYYFFAGAGSNAELKQDVDVSFYSSTIDANIQSFAFEGYVRSYDQNPTDASRLIIEYLDSLKINVLDSFDSGEYTNISEWELISDTRIAPINTRFISVRLISKRYSGTNNDGYFDALSLQANGFSVDDENHYNYNKIVLYQNYPNPFNGHTSIMYSLPRPGNVKIFIYNLKGQLLNTLVNDNKNAGYHSAEWITENISSGIYFYKLSVDGNTEVVKKCLLVK